MDSESLIRTVNRTASIKISSLRRVYEREDFDNDRAHPILGEVVNRLRPPESNIFLQTDQPQKPMGQK